MQQIYTFLCGVKLLWTENCISEEILRNLENCVLVKVMPNVLGIKKCSFLKTSIAFKTDLLNKGHCSLNSS